MKVKSIEEWVTAEVPSPHREHLLRLMKHPELEPWLRDQWFITFTGAITTLVNTTFNTFEESMESGVMTYLQMVLAQAHPSIQPHRRKWDFSDSAVQPKPAPVAEAPVAETQHTDRDSGMTQCKTIYEHMLNKGPITQIEATRLYDITRLACRISDLKKAGHTIETEMIRFGKYGRYAKYSLPKEGA